MAPNLLLGTTHHQFRLDEIIGYGAMAVVYKAYDMDLGRPVAIKIPFDGRSYRLWKEAAAPASLSHRQIATIYEVNRPNQEPFIAMQYIEGKNLGSLMSRGALSSTTATRYILELLSPLECAHRSNVIHRDLKPDNVIIEKWSDLPFITDFGLAKVIGQSGGSIDGVPIGTPGYMSPEQALGLHDRVGPWSDIFSWGAMLYEAQCGQLPFDDGSRDVDAILHRLKSRRPPILLGSRAPCVDEFFEAMVMKCLHPDSKHRYRSCEELFHDVKQLKNGHHL
jgi:serine/threonine-protein kinase